MTFPWRVSAVCYFFLCVLIYVWVPYAICNIIAVPTLRMSLDQTTIELGKQLSISCEINTGMITGISQWEKRLASTDSRLSHFGVFNNSAKYQEYHISRKKYQLTIINVTEDDINCQYSCRSGFLAANINITTNERNFRSLPTEHQTKKEYVNDKQNFTTLVQFYKVYPVPSCILKSKLTYQSENPYHSCDSALEVECFFGETSYITKIEHKLNCNRQTQRLDEDNYMLPVVILVFFLVVGFTIFLMICLLRRRGTPSSSTTCNDQEEKLPPLMENCETPSLETAASDGLVPQPNKCNTNLTQYSTTDVPECLTNGTPN